MDISVTSFGWHFIMLHILLIISESTFNKKSESNLLNSSTESNSRILSDSNSFKYKVYFSAI